MADVRGDRLSMGLIGEVGWKMDCVHMRASDIRLVGVEQHQMKVDVTVQFSHNTQTFRIPSGRELFNGRFSMVDWGYGTKWDYYRRRHV